MLVVGFFAVAGYGAYRLVMRVRTVRAAA
jgi:hypothetical protein